MDSVDRTLTTLRKKRATGTGNHMLLIFHLQKLGRWSSEAKEVKCAFFPRSRHGRVQTSAGLCKSADVSNHLIRFDHMATYTTFVSFTVTPPRTRIPATLVIDQCFPDIPSLPEVPHFPLRSGSCSPNYMVNGCLSLLWWTNYNPLPGRSKPAPTCSFLFVRSVC